MEGPSKSLRDVLVWQKAHAFALAIWRASASFSRKELFVITAHLRRAATSVRSNFVEGFRKRTKTDKIRFCNIAQGSADECLYLLILAKDFGYGETTTLQADLEEVSRLLQGYINGLERNS